MPVSMRSRKINPSQTLSISALSNQLIAQNKDVINLSVGQPDFPTPDYIKEAAIEAIHKNMTRYTPVDGTVRLKQAIINKFQRENQLDYSEKQVIVSSGAKHSLSLLCQALLNKGDEVIIPAPFWTTYPEMVKLADGEPTIIASNIKQGFKITAHQLEKSINKQTKMLMLNSPNNPTGACYTAEELRDIGDVLKKNPAVLICSDDIYEHFIYDGNQFSNILNVCPELYDRTLVVNGVSKAYSMTGWRIGYTAGPEEIIATMKKLQSQSTSNPCSISQAAAQAALDDSEKHLQFIRQAFVKQRNFLFESIQQINGFEVIKPQGSFYAFPDCSEFLATFNKANSDLELAEYLLNQFYIATIPGTAFGAPNHLRISFSTSLEEIERAITRLLEALSS